MTWLPFALCGALLAWVWWPRKRETRPARMDLGPEVEGCQPSSTCTISGHFHVPYDDTTRGCTALWRDDNGNVWTLPPCHSCGLSLSPPQYEWERSVRCICGAVTALHTEEETE